MEILIVGIVLVALMVYTSTRIKKSAARAFEREIIDTDEYRLIKPEGFLSPVDENSEFIFKAHSKNFGENEAREIHQAKVDLKMFSNADFDSVCDSIKQSADKVLSENISTEASHEQKICLLEIEQTENEMPFYVFHKIVENEQKQKIYDLKVLVLKDFREQYEEQVGEILSSFSAI